MRNRLSSHLLPNRIREHRVARGLTLREVAAKARCSIVQLSDLERGNRKLSLSWMRRIGKALGVEPGQLLLQGDNAGGLSSEEKELIMRYRSGSAEQQFMILAIARVINRAV